MIKRLAAGSRIAGEFTELALDGTGCKPFGHRSNIHALTTEPPNQQTTCNACRRRYPLPGAWLLMIR